MSSADSLAKGETAQLRVLSSYMAFWFTIFAFAVWWVRNRKVQQNIPGPGQYFLGGIANGLAIRNVKTTFSVFDAWCQKYGEVMKVKFFLKTVIVLNSPDYVQKLLGSTDMNYHGKGFIYKALKPGLKDSLPFSTGDKWKLRRRHLAKHLFSYRILISYTEIFNEEANCLLKAIEESVIGNEMVVDGLLKNYSLSCITKTTLGFTPDEFAKEEDDVSLAELVGRLKEIAAKRIMQPWLLCNPIWKLHPLSKVEETLIKLGWKQTQPCISKTPEEGLKNIPSLKVKSLTTAISADGILEETVALISAGFETTVTSIQLLLFMLALHPHHQQLCREEVDALFAGEDDFIDLKFQDLSKLKHLEMCVSESLRLFPAIFLIMRKLTAPLQLAEGLEIGSGTDVGIYLPGLHRNPELFPNPNDFIPERFSEEENKNRHPYSFIPFSAGPRKCIGYRFAIMEMICVTAKLLRHFDISTLDKIEDIVFLPYITITLEKPIRFIFEKRRT